MITKCEYPGCTKAGACRAPKSRDLREYWHFCRAHAAEYNKNWNYYAGMTPSEIEADWERTVFGIEKNTAQQTDTSADYTNFIRDFLSGRSGTQHSPARPKMRGEISAAFATLDLPPNASWRDVGVRYRALAKKYHPDTATNKKTATAKFTQISNAYEILKKYFKS